MATTKMKPLHLFVPFTKIERRAEDDALIVEGYCFTQEIVEGEGGVRLKRSAMEAATPDYMKFGAVREMHQPIAAGTAITAVWDEGGCILRSECVDPIAKLKIERGVYKGYSVGVNPVVMRGNDVEVCKWPETSYVDRPKDPGATFNLHRAEGFDPEAEVEVEVLDAVLPTADQPSEDQSSSDDVSPSELTPAPDPSGAGDSSSDAPLADPQLIEMRAVLIATGMSAEMADKLLAIPEVTRQLESEDVPSRENLEGKGKKKKGDADGDEDGDGDGDADGDEAKKERGDAEPDVERAADKPEGDYGSSSDAGYADPGYQDDKKPRYPLKEGGKLSSEKVHAAWSYINQRGNAAKYSSADLAKIKGRIRAAAKEIGMEISEDRAEDRYCLMRTRAGALQIWDRETGSLESCADREAADRRLEELARGGDPASPGERQPQPAGRDDLDYTIEREPTGMYCLYSPQGGKLGEFATEAEARARLDEIKEAMNGAELPEPLGGTNPPSYEDYEQNVPGAGPPRDGTRAAIAALSTELSTSLTRARVAETELARVQAAHEGALARLAVAEARVVALENMPAPAPVVRWPHALEKTILAALGQTGDAEIRGMQAELERLQAISPEGLSQEEAQRTSADIFKMRTQIADAVMRGAARR